MAQCKIIKSPLTGKNTQSRLWSDLYKKFKTNEVADSIYRVATSSEFLLSFGNWIKSKTKLLNTYLTGEPHIDSVLNFVRKQELPIESAENAEKERSKLIKQIKAVTLDSNSVVSQEKAKEATESIVFYLMDYFNLNKINLNKKIDVEKAFAHAKKEFTDLVQYQETEESKKQIEDVLLPENWSKLEKLAVDKLEAMGFKFKNRAIDYFDDEDISMTDNQDEAGKIKENQWADSSFTVDPKSTASNNLKMKLATIEQGTFVNDEFQPEFTIYGVPKFINIDTAYTQLLRIFSNTPNLNQENYKDVLEDYKKEMPWLEALEYAIENDYSQARKNELFTNIKKIHNRFNLTLFNKGKKGGYDLTPTNSNRNSAEQIVIDTWYENFKNSKYYSLGKVETNGIYQQYTEITKLKDNSAKSAALSLLFNEIGIELTKEQVLDLLSSVKGQEKIYSKYVPKEVKKIRTYLSVTLDENSFFNQMFSKFKNTEENDDEINNPFVGENSVANDIKSTLVKLYLEHNPESFSDSHKNVNGDTVYAYSQYKMLEKEIDKIKNGEAPELNNYFFVKDSNGNDCWLLKNLKENNINLEYREGLKKRGDDTGTDPIKATEKEYELHVLAEILNKGNKKRIVRLPTISDKTTCPSLRVPEVKLAVNNSLISDSGMEKLYELAFAERKRIQEARYLIENEKSLPSNFKTGSQLFLFFPLLNKNKLKEAIVNGDIQGYSVEEIDSIFANNNDLPTDDLIKSIVDVTLGKQVYERLNIWRNLSIVPNENDITNGEKIFLDSQWMQKNKFKAFSTTYKNNKKTITANKGEVTQAYLQAALEVEYYQMLVAGEYYRVIGGDPAWAFKKNEDATAVEVIKRNAKDIAPGNEPHWMLWDIESKSFKMQKNYKIAIVKDVVLASANEYINSNPVLKKAYSEIKGTDAQEWTLATEHLDTLFAKGQVEDDIYITLKTKLHNQEQNGVNNTNRLSQEELTVIMQPQKPVQVVNYTVGNFVSKVYVKSSSIPLVPQLLEGTELKKIQEKMAKLGIQRFAFETAVKVGGFNMNKIYDDNGKLLDDFDLKSITLNREGFRIQQEVPYDENKAKIVTISQMNKLITEGILNMEGFVFKDETLTGEEVRNKKEDLRKQMFEIGKQELFEKLKVSEEPIFDKEGVQIGNKLKFNKLSKIKDMILEEAYSRGFPLNDIYSLKLTEQGDEFEIPLFFNNSSNKFESLLTSVVSKIVLNKMPGKSYVQSSNQSWIFNEDYDLNNSDITFTNSSNFDKTKGLQTITQKDGKVISAQVLIPFNYKDNNGKALKLGQNIKIEDIDPELFKLVGARIPNQGHNSMIPLEVVGFLPPYMGDVVIYPSELTIQMGCDNDVDKLYTYQFNTRLLNNGKLEKYNEGHGSMKQLQNDYIDLHFSVLTHSDMTNKILAPLDVQDLADAAKVINTEDKKVRSLISAEFNKQAQFENRSGKDGVGAESLASTYNSILQGRKIELMKSDKDGNPVPFFLNIRNSKGQIISLNAFSDNKNLKGVGHTIFNVYDKVGNITGTYERNKALNIQNLQSESVDNAKSGILGKINLNNTTFAVANALLMLEDSTKTELNVANNNTVAFILKQEIVEEYVKSMELLNDRTIEEFDPYKKENMVKGLIEKYSKLAGIISNFKFDETYVLPSETDLLNIKLNLKETNSKAYYMHQVDILKFFLKLEELGNSMRDVMTSTNSDSKGVGKSLISANIKAQRFNRIEANSIYTSPLLNSDEMIQIDGIDSLTNGTELGSATNNSIKLASNLFSDLYVYNSPVIQNIFELYAGIKGLNSLNDISESEQRLLLNEFKAFIFTSKDLDLISNVQSEQERLLKGENSLSERLLKLKKQYKNNYFLKRLGVKNEEGIKMVVYNAAISLEYDDAENTRGFAELLLNEDTKDFAVDLIKYSYLTSGTQNAKNFLKYIPASILLNNKFSENLRSINESLYDELNNSGIELSFLKQFIQNNPYKALKVTDEFITGGSKTFDVKDSNIQKISRTNYLKEEQRNLLNFNGLTLPPLFIYKYVMNPKSKMFEPVLYQLYINSNGAAVDYVYNVIPTLGTDKLGITEYNANLNFWDNKPSIINENNTRYIETQKTIEPEIIKEEIEKENNNTEQEKLLDKYNIQDGKFSNEALQTSLSLIKTFGSDDHKIIAELLSEIPEAKQTKIGNNNKLNAQAEALPAQKIISTNIEKITIAADVLNITAEQQLQKTLLHELLHVVTSDKIDKWEKDNTSVTKEEAKAIENLNKLKDVVIEKLKEIGTVNIDGNVINYEGYLNYLKNYKSDAPTRYSSTDVNIYYCLTDSHEFITGAMTKPEFQKFINKIKYSGDKSFFDRFSALLTKLLKAIAKSYNITSINEGSVLENAIGNILVLSEDKNKTNIKIESTKRQPNEFTPDNITSLKPNEIFVFGSNAEGAHGKGAALLAKEKFGAKQGQAEGLQGQSYAVITKKDWRKEKSSTLGEIENGLREMLHFARENSDKKFLVTKLGSSLAGYTVGEIKNLFIQLQDFIPNNVVLPKEYEVRDNDALLTNVENVYTSDTFKYFGANYTIKIKNGKAIEVENYKGKQIDENKILNAYNNNPDVDPQNGKNFRNVETKAIEKQVITDSQILNLEKFNTININGVELETTATKNGKKISIELTTGQKEALQEVANAYDNFLNKKGDNEFRLLGRAGCLGYGTKVLMFDGKFKEVQDVKIGDLLMGVDSTPRTVLDLKRGIEQMYWVHQVKGASYRVNEQHILSLKEVNSDRKTVKVKNIKLIDYLNLSKGNTLKKQGKGYQCEAIEFTKKELLINPYYLGLWLGDGHTESIRKITNIDIEIIQYLKEIGITNENNITYTIHNKNKELTDAFKKIYNIQNSTKLEEKYIPDEYLYSSIEDRLNLLAGLFDSDGYYCKKGKTYEICSKHKLLAEQITYLCRSLGFKVTNSIKTITNSKFKKEKYFYYRLSITVDRLIPCKIKRKQNELRTQIKNLRHTGIKIEKDIVDKYYGFALDGDNLFILEDFTVTHNTGKSTVIKIIKEYINKRSPYNKGLVIMTPTHKAGKVASNMVNGRTGNYITVASALAKAKMGQKVLPTVIALDEISTINKYDFDSLNNIYPPESGVFKVVMGDKGQLPPIGNTVFSKQLNARANKLSDYFNKRTSNSYELTEVKRFDDDTAIALLTNTVRSNLKDLKGGIVQYGNTEHVKIVDSKQRLVDAFMYYRSLYKTDNEKGLVKLIAYGNNTVDMYNNQIRTRLYKEEADKPLLKGEILMGDLNWGMSATETPIQNSQDYIVLNDPIEKEGLINFPVFENGKAVRQEKIQFLSYGVEAVEVQDKPDEYAQTKFVRWVDISKNENKEFAQKLFNVFLEKNKIDKKFQFASEPNKFLQEIEKMGIVVPNVLYRIESNKHVTDYKGLMAARRNSLKAQGKTETNEQLIAAIDKALESNAITSISGNIGYGYAITTHKAQGSTYKHVMVDEENISYKEDKRLTVDENGDFFAYEANQMRYVAFSRPTDTLVIYTQKQTGDNFIVAENKKEELSISQTANDSIKLKSSLDDFLKSLTPSERLAFTKLKLNKTIETKC